MGRSSIFEKLMDKIIINDLEVFYRIGVSEEERAAPQRLLISLEMTRDVSAAAAADDLTKTIDYYAVTRRLLAFGERRSWKLLEKLAVALSFACVAAGQSGRPLDPEELRNYKEPQIDTKFAPFEFYS